MLEDRYKEQYRQNPHLNRKGRIVDDCTYEGDYYRLELQKEDRKKAVVLNIIVSIGMMVLFVLAGLVNNEGTRKVYIVLPYICIFMPLFYMFIGACSFAGVPERMQFAHYDRSLCRSRRSCIGAMVLAAIVFLLDLIYTIANHSTVVMGREILFLACMAGLLLAGIGYMGLYKKYFSKVTVEKATA